jgi:hypothetical protein
MGAGVKASKPKLNQNNSHHHGDDDSIFATFAKKLHKLVISMSSEFKAAAKVKLCSSEMECVINYLSQKLRKGLKKGKVNPAAINAMFLIGRGDLAFEITRKRRAIKPAAEALKVIDANITEGVSDEKKKLAKTDFETIVGRRIIATRRLARFFKGTATRKAALQNASRFNNLSLYVNTLFVSTTLSNNLINSGSVDPHPIFELFPAKLRQFYAYYQTAALADSADLSVVEDFIYIFTREQQLYVKSALDATAKPSKEYEKVLIDLLSAFAEWKKKRENRVAHRGPAGTDEELLRAKLSKA